MLRIKISKFAATSIIKLSYYYDNDRYIDHRSRTNRAFCCI